MGYLPPPQKSLKLGGRGKAESFPQMQNKGARGHTLQLASGMEPAGTRPRINRTRLDLLATSFIFNHTHRHVHTHIHFLLLIMSFLLVLLPSLSTRSTTLPICQLLTFSICFPQVHCLYPQICVLPTIYFSCSNCRHSGVAGENQVSICMKWDSINLTSA